ncbi:MAG: MFS transporter [Saprospiraceae bacterium]
MAELFNSTAKLFKDSYSGHPKEIWALSILTLINRSGTMVLPFLAVYLTTVLDFSFKDAGFLVSAFGFGSFFGAYLGGKFSDKIGSSPVIVISMIVSGCFFIGLQYALTFEQIFITIFFTALFGDAYRPAMTAAASSYVPSGSMGRTMAFLRLAVNLGMSFAPLIGGFVAVSMGYNWLFVIDGVTCIVAGIYFWIVSRNWKTTETKEEKAKNEASRVESLPPYKNSTFLIFLFATFLVGFSFIQWFHTVPVFIKTEWGFDERYIGLMTATSCFIVVLIEMPLIHYIEKVKKNKLFTLIGILLIGASFLFFFLPKALYLCFIGISVLTFGEILYLPFNHSTTVNLSPKNRRGEYQSWYYMTWSLAHITAPVIGLWIADTFSFDWFWGLVVVFILISFIMNKVFSDRIIK